MRKEDDDDQRVLQNQKPKNKKYQFRIWYSNVEDAKVSTMVSRNGKGVH